MTLLGGFKHCIMHFSTHQCKEGADDAETTHDPDEEMDLLMLRVREERVLALHPTTLNILVPALLVVGIDQGRLAAGVEVELKLFDTRLEKMRNIFGYIK